MNISNFIGVKSTFFDMFSLSEAHNLLIDSSHQCPFGMVMDGRSGASGEYRYGFQGQEMDDEVKGKGNSVNYKYRMHDPRIGRFFARDPLERKYPWYTPYQFSGNKVIHMVELEGLEEGPLEYRKAQDVTSEEAEVDPIVLVPEEYLKSEISGVSVTYHDYYPDIAKGTHMKAEELWVFRFYYKDYGDADKYQIHNGTEWINAKMLTKKEYYEQMGGYVHLPEEHKFYELAREAIKNGTRMMHTETLEGEHTDVIVKRFEDGLPISWYYTQLWYQAYGKSQQEALFGIVFNSQMSGGSIGGKKGKVGFAKTGLVPSKFNGPFKPMAKGMWQSWSSNNSGKYVKTNYGGSSIAASRARKQDYQIYKRDNGYEFDQSIIDGDF